MKNATPNGAAFFIAETEVALIERRRDGASRPKGGKA
jgi:hypothetical protein